MTKKGYKQTLEHKKKVAMALKGKKRSLQAREHISIGMARYHAKAKKAIALMEAKERR